jgi:hypothetical protein
MNNQFLIHQISSSPARKGTQSPYLELDHQDFINYSANFSEEACGHVSPSLMSNQMSSYSFSNLSIASMGISEAQEVKKCRSEKPEMTEGSFL